jgi:ABC-2 type transport system permease protein
MRTVLTMAMKDLRLMSRDWLGMFFIIGFPIVMGLFFGQVMGPFDTKRASLNIAVVDEDNTPMSAKFAESLRSTGNIELEKADRASALDRVRRGQLVGMIAIPKGFGESAGMPWQQGPAIEVGIDPSRGAESGMLQGLIMQAAGRLMMDRFQDPASMRSLIDKSRKDIESDTQLSPAMRPVLLTMMSSLESFMKSVADTRAAEAASKGKAKATMPEFEVAHIETLDVTREIPKGSKEALVRQIRSKWDVSFPQAMMWGVLACAAGFAITLVRERKQGTLMRLQVAPVTRAQVLAGKAMACFLAVLGVIVLMLVFGFWLGMRPRNPGWLALAALSIAICFVGIMMLMSVIGKTEESVSGAAWSANMLMAMFGGAMVPLLFMPSFMKTLSNFSPVKWSILALEGSIWRGFTLSEMMVPCVVLIGIGVVCLTIGTRILSRSTG